MNIFISNEFLFIIFFEMLKKSKFDLEFLNVLNHLANKTHNPFPNNYFFFYNLIFLFNSLMN